MNIINDITNFIFLENEPEEADIIFIAGTSWPAPTERAAKLYNDGYSPYILPSGKYGVKLGHFPDPKAKSDIYNGNYATEWEYMKDVLIKCGVPSTSILKEDCAEFTYENAFKSRKVTDENELDIKKAIICCQAFHARRCMMYYKWAFPEAEFILCPAETQSINKNNWYKSEYGIKRVMGELMRCGDQLQEAIPFYREFLK